MNNTEFFETLADLLVMLEQAPDLPLIQPNWQTQTTSKALSDIWYIDGQDGRETRCYYGVVQIDDHQAEYISLINGMKARLLAALTDLKATHNDWQTDFAQRLPELNSCLAAHQLSRLHLKQLWRQLPLESQAINTIRFSWYQSGRSIKRLSVKQVMQMLEKHNQALDHIQMYWDKLNRLSEDEPLAQIQQQAPLIRANLWYAESGERRAFNASMPIFTTASVGRISFPEPFTPGERKRAQRSDVKIDPDPYLPALRIHRYY